MIAIVTKFAKNLKSNDLVQFLRYGEAVVGIGFDLVIILDRPETDSICEGARYDHWIKCQLSLRLPPGKEVERLDQ